MMKCYKLVLCLTFCFILIGCGKREKNNPTALPEVTTKVKDHEVKSEDEKSVKDIKASENKIKIKDDIKDLLQSSDKNYTIEDKNYELKDQKGKTNIKYPVLQSDEMDMNVVNSAILARVVEELQEQDTEATIDTDLDYEIEYANSSFISILFTGIYNAHHAAHPHNMSFTINFDLKHNRLLSLCDVAHLEDDLWEKVHRAMKSQFEESEVEAFMKLTEQKLIEQIKNQKEEFYIKQEDIYIRLSIPAGAGYHTYIKFPI